jgi:ATP-dependent Clp protease adaptor protein ClpS
VAQNEPVRQVRPEDMTRAAVQEPTTEQETRSQEAIDVPWQVVVHNDPVNLMTYVTMVFQRVFGYPREKSERHMLEVHQKGRSVLWSGARERAELYVQQGVLSEARPLFLQLAEMQLKAGRQPQAALLLRKLLEAEPDNLRVQIRLAELHLSMGQQKEAIETFHGAMQRIMEQGDYAEAIRMADRILQLNASHQATFILKVRALTASGKGAASGAGRANRGCGPALAFFPFAGFFSPKSSARAAASSFFFSGATSG